MINEFKGKYGWLSNFWLCSIEFEGLIYPSTENAFQAAKTFNSKEKLRFAHILSPKESKKWGRQLQLRHDWNDIKLDVMEQVNRSKFIKGSHLADKLIATENRELIEGNRWGDLYWGANIEQSEDFSGRNHLGKILMKIRKDLE